MRGGVTEARGQAAKCTLIAESATSPTIQKTFFETLNCSRLRELDYRCLAPVVARARHRGLRIQDQHRDAASGAHGLTPSVLNSARHLSSSLAIDLRSSTILLAGSSLPRLFFDYLGQGFELSAKPIKMLFVPFRFSKQL